MRKTPCRLLLFLGLAACATTATLDRSSEGGDVARSGTVPPPITLDTSAYEAAADVELPEVPPQELEGLHNYYELSENIVSGSEPEGEAAFRALAERGIKTILSVDGAEPDVEIATRYGIRYVHVPIRYSGIEHDEILAIAKTFRELEGPFYTHCFHGKHRGPAAAAVGRIVLDGISREQALAEMRQWCGTSAKYEGLYETIATADLPDAEETSHFAFDFPSAHRFTGQRHAMIELTRHWDVVEALAKRDWQPDPEHPDWDARNATTKVAQIFGQLLAMPEVQDELQEYRDWLTQARDGAEELRALLGQGALADAGADARAQQAVELVKASCTECHAAYRD